jgi:hypothetical protein
MHTKFWLRRLKGRTIQENWRRWENTIKINFRNVGLGECIGYIRLKIADIPVVGSFEHGGVPSDSGKGEEFLDQRNVLSSSGERPCSVETVNCADT